MKKMKTKILVLVGIAMCAILLTAPVLASAGYSKIYGNANEDDVLDMRDVTYIKLVIFGKKPATTFADANYDGKISMLDIGQTKLIILGKEKQLTLVDMVDRTVTVPRPIERVVSCPPDPTRIIIALGEGDKLVGTNRPGCICYSSPKDAPVCAAKVCGGRLFELPLVGSCTNCVNMELIVSLNPDVVFGYSSTTADVTQGKTGISVVTVVGYGPGRDLETAYRGIETVGKVLEKEEEAEELISFMEEKTDKVRKITSEIPDEKKPKVYLANRGYSGGSMGKFTTTTNCYVPLDTAGGINVAKEVPGAYQMVVSKEQIIEWNPDVIIIAHSFGTSLEAMNDVECVLSDPDLQLINAVKNERVYFTLYPHCCGAPHDRNLVATLYLAKVLHPDKFKDLNVEEEGNEIYKRFLGVDGLFSEYADYTIWMREWLDSQK